MSFSISEWYRSHSRSDLVKWKFYLLMTKVKKSSTRMWAELHLSMNIRMLLTSTRLIDWRDRQWKREVPLLQRLLLLRSLTLPKRVYSSFKCSLPIIYYSSWSVKTLAILFETYHKWEFENLPWDLSQWIFVCIYCCLCTMLTRCE